jgi:hypothetical protein
MVSLLRASNLHLRHVMRLCTQADTASKLRFISTSGCRSSLAASSLLHVAYLRTFRGTRPLQNQFALVMLRSCLARTRWASWWTARARPPAVR